MIKGEIITTSNSHIIRVEKFADIKDITRRIDSATIYSKVTNQPYELNVIFYDFNQGEETDSVVNGGWRRDNDWDIPKEMLVIAPKKTKKKR